MQKETGEWHETMTNDCDKWIVFGDTLTKGGKNDHVFHNATLTHLINFYDSERKIDNNVVHTDNCAGQYKCRHNFWKIATSFNDRSSRIVHKFAEKYCFIGSWDATGKLVKAAILKNEMKYERWADALIATQN